MIGPLLRTLFSRFLLLLLILVGALPMLIFLMLPKHWLYDSKLFFWFGDIFCKAVVKVTLLPITFIGKENIPHEPAIFAANHQSSLDIPLVGSLLNGQPHVWLAKKELMDSPILRFVLPRVAVLIDMSTPIRGMRSLLQAIKWINGSHRHAIIFPEGGRYTDGKIHDFYSGFVILAKKTGRPVVPVCIIGADKVYPPDTFLINYHQINVVVGKPFRMQEGESDEAFKNRVRQWFVEMSEE